MMGSRSLASLAVVCMLAAPACASTKASIPSHLTVAPADVPDAAYAKALVGILQDGSRADQREKTLLGVVRRQLVHAGQRYDHGASDRATQSVLGAFYLMRTGEQSKAIVDQMTARGIDGAIDKLSARGDIGRARVLLAMRAESMTLAERKETDDHIASLERFRGETLTGKQLEKAGDVERTAMGMALLLPEHLDTAMIAIDRWIGLGIQGKVSFEQTGKRPPQEEALEIARSVSSGSATVVALMLRYGDVGGALEKIKSTNARRVMEPQFFAQLVEVEKHDDAGSWRNLFDSLAEDVEERIGGDMGIDPDLYAAARFTILIEAYRRDPSHAATALELAKALTDFGMSEAAPLVLEGAVAHGATATDVVQALRVLTRAINADASAHDVAAAARTIAVSDGLLGQAKTILSKRGGASAIADLRYSMASILLKGGYLQEAQQVLTSAIADAPKASGYLLRAQVYRQMNVTDKTFADKAMSDLKQVVETKGVDPLDVADARLIEHEIRRDQGDADAAKAALNAALSSATGAVDKYKTGAPKVRALAALGRVLQAYGDREAARKTFNRALAAVEGDRELMGATMLHAASAELALGDREGVRAALRNGVDGGAPQQDLVYVAVWLMLADRQSGAQTDDAVSDILAGAAAQPTWIGRLASWARGKLSDEALAKSASSEASRLEAAFYVAMAKRARGAIADDALRRVASSRVIQAHEVQIARDILAPRPPYGVPKDVKIP